MPVMTEDVGLSSPTKPSFMTFIKQLKQRPPKDDSDPFSPLSTSPNSISPYLQPMQGSYDKAKPRPPLYHMSHSAAAISSRPLSSSYETPTSNTSKGIFGVPLEQSIKCAHATIQIRDKNNQAAVGKIPVIVANCARLLKRDATQIEGIFRLSGSARRIKELQLILTDPNQNYGKDLDWSPYSVHDAANLLRRYLNYLPEPIVPLLFYDKFREPLDKYPNIVEHLQGLSAISATSPPSSTPMSPATNTEEGDTQVNAMSLSPPRDSIDPLEKESTSEGDKAPPVDLAQLKKESRLAVKDYRDLIEKLPILNQQLLLYILDLLYTFTRESDKNLMPAVNLASIFQPSILSHPSHDMSPQEYHLSRAITQFLIENFPKLAGCAVRTWVPSDDSNAPQANSHLMSPVQRKHSRSMSSVNVPNAVNDLGLEIYTMRSKNEPITNEATSMGSTAPTNGSTPKLTESTLHQHQQQQSLQKPSIFRRRSRRSSESPFNSNPTSGRNSPMVSPSDETRSSSGGFFQSLKRTASLSRRRANSSSTTSSVLGLEQQNNSTSSLTGQRQGSRSGSIPNVSVTSFNESSIEEESTPELKSELHQDVTKSNTTTEPSDQFPSDESGREDDSRKDVDAMEEIKEETLEAVAELPSEDEASFNKPPVKSPSSVTIKPNVQAATVIVAKPVPKRTEIKSMLIDDVLTETKNNLPQPPQVFLTTTSANDFSDMDTSEAETSQSELTDVTSTSFRRLSTRMSSSSKHQHSISSLLRRRSGSQSLSLGQNPSFTKIDNHRMFAGTNELSAPYPSSSLTSPAINSVQSVNGSSVGSAAVSPAEIATSPRRSLAYFGLQHANDSESSVGLESDEDFGSTLSGQAEPTKMRGSTRSRKNVSKWRRSLMALNIPFPSPNSAEEDRNPLESHA